jgi:hypothetical protein
MESWRPRFVWDFRAPSRAGSGHHRRACNKADPAPFRSARGRRHGMTTKRLGPHDQHLASLLRRVADRSVTNDQGCLEWLGATTAAGYGAIHYRGRTVPVHRAYYEAQNNPLGRGDVVVHTCCDPAACPGGRDCPHRRCLSHLAVISRAKCHRGHPLTWTSSGDRRTCLECGRRRSREHERRKARESNSPSEASTSDRLDAQDGVVDAGPNT